MLDPFPIPPIPLLSRAIQPLSDLLNLPILPLHIHEVLFALCLYTFINKILSPRLSTYLFPIKYPALSAEKKLNWDVHMVSLAQSSLINVLALWVMWRDEERWGMDWEQRIWGYTGASGMIQGLAGGYFLWDLIVTVGNVRAFGFGMFMHALCALTVFSFGFRPFLHYYAVTFILYELSSPLLNFHWFFDKLDLTGSTAQLINGIFLLITFFSCRLVWGTYQSVRVYQDIWKAVHHAPVDSCAFDASFGIGKARLFGVGERGEGMNGTVLSAGGCVAVQRGVMVFAGDEVVPVWLAFTYLASNVVLNTLNFFWFTKMIDAIRKRFSGPKVVKGVKGVKEENRPVAVKVTGVNGAAKIEVDQVDVRRRGVADVENEKVTGTGTPEEVDVGLAM